MNKKITKVKIGPIPMHLFDSMPSVNVVYEDEIQEKLFDFYPDEISFKEEDFIGLTKNQAMNLRHKKDVAYLRS